MTFSIRIDRDVEMRTRDGVVLRADVYRPDITAKVPAIVQRTPYDKSNRMPGLLTPMEAVAAGYAMVRQDCRGRFRSEGEWNVIDWNGVERPDGYDCIEWLASEPWCDGNIGMIGASYEAGNQIAAAREQPPHLRCMAPSAGGGDDSHVLQAQMTWETIIISWSAMMAVDVLTKRAADGEDVTAEMSTVMAALKDPGSLVDTLPLEDLPVLKIRGMPSYAEMLEVLKRASKGFTGEEERIQVPALINTGWYDIGVGFQLFRSLRAKCGTELARSGTKTIVGPWGHNGHGWNIGEWGNGQYASVEGAGIPQSHLQFYDRHVRGDDAVPELPNVRYFVMGTREWKDADDWPIPGTELRLLYLHSRGAANGKAGDGALSATEPNSAENPDRYRYDPGNPVASFGLRVMYNGASTVHGPFDQHRVERRDDVLVYTAEPFDELTEVAGDLELILFAATSAADTDFVAKVCDVDPDGNSRNIADGFLRLRFRDGWDHEITTHPGEVYRLRIDLGPTAHAFRPGHAIRLQITSSCFPHWDRNMNTGNRPGTDSVGVVANQTVFHDAERSSYLVVPIASRAETRPSVIPPPRRPG
jgi:putative CocE/NonD family hydrolase